MAIVGVLTLFGTLGGQMAFAAPGCTATFSAPAQDCGGGGGGGTPDYITTFANSTPGAVGRPYSFQYQSTVAGSTFTVTSGSLPPGLALSASGLVSGTPTIAGSFDYLVTASSSDPFVSSVTNSDQITVQPAPVPSAPTTVTATVTSATAVHLTWNAPSDSGAYPVSSYAVSWAGGSTTTTGTAADIGGLTTGTSYSFTVSAVSQAGTGPGATSNAVTPAGVPGTVPVVSVTAGDGIATFRWSDGAATNGSAIQEYHSEVSGDGFKTVRSGLDAPADVLAFTARGLQNGTTYSFRVFARNGMGTGPASEVLTTTPSGVPGAPSATVSAGDRQLSATWVAPTANGATITGYTVTLRSGGAVVDTRSSASPSTVTFSGLQNGTAYTVDVAATNSNGTTTGPAVTATPRGVPGAATGLSATDGDGSSVLSWTAASPNGQTPQYRVEQSADGGTSWTRLGTTSATSWTASSLTNGRTYGYRVTAFNDAGDGEPAQTTARPYGAPSAPQTLRLTPGDREATAGWSAPASDGGRPVTRYTVETSTNGTDWAAAGTTDALTFRLTGLTNGAPTSVRVRAQNARGVGAPSSVQTTTTSGVPGATTVASADPGDRSVTVTWTAPDTNGSAVTGYLVEQSTDGEVWTASTTRSAVGTGTTAVVTGLDNGTEVRVRVTARNANGRGTPGAAVAVTPFSVPDAPDAPTVTPGDGSATVRWAAPFDGGRSITSYRVERQTVDGEWTGVATTDGDGRSTTDSGLENGTSVAYRIVALNRAGASGPSAATTTRPRTVPGAPTVVVATPHDRSVQLNWSAPTDDGGDTVTAYWVEQEVDGQYVRVDTLDGTTTTIHDLSNGTSSSFRVRAVNAAGAGQPSGPVSATPRTVPGSPDGLRGTAGEGSVDLDWTAPTDDGGAAVTGYTVEQLDASGDWIVTRSTTDRTVHISGQPNGARLTFRVRATNDAGTGPASDPVVVVPSTVPDAPTALVATPGDRSATLTWTTPEWNGGATVSAYRVERAIGDGDWETVGTATDTTSTVNGLPNGTATRFRVSAVNVAGTGRASEPVTTTARTVSAAPTGLIATPGDRQVELTWAAPEVDGGSAVTGYVVQQRTDDGASWQDVGPADGTTLAVAGLSNGVVVSFRVLAVNAAGRGDASESVSVTPRRSPDEPRALTAEPGDRSVVLRWTAPESDGGAPVEAYLVQTAAADGTWGDARRVSGTTATIDGLDNGSAYGFRVAAENAGGTGAWSAVTTSTPFVFAPTFTDEDGVSVVGKTLTVGDTVVFSADHLPVGAAVALELHSTVQVLAAGTVGEGGSIRLQATIPTLIEPGMHHLVATIDGVGTTVAPVEVAIRLAPAPVPVPAPVPSPAPGPGTGTTPRPAAGDPAPSTVAATRPGPTASALAFTGGADPAPLTIGGLALLLAGLGLAAAVRGRRRRA